jgi:hypothetical protein
MNQHGGADDHRTDPEHVRAHGQSLRQGGKPKRGSVPRPRRRPSVHRRAGGIAAGGKEKSPKQIEFALGTSF